MAEFQKQVLIDRIHEYGHVRAASGRSGSLETWLSIIKALDALIAAVRVEVEAECELRAEKEGKCR